MSQSFGSSTGMCRATQQYSLMLNWHFPKVDKTLEQKDPLMVTLSWWHHPCTQQKLRLNSAEQKPWLATQYLYSNSTLHHPLPCHQSAIPRSNPLTIYGVKSYHWPCCPPQPSSVPTTVGRVTANISECFQHCTMQPQPVPCGRKPKHLSKHPEMHRATSRINL